MNIHCYSEICATDDTLRPYQQKAKKEIFKSWDRVDSVMFQMPTGTGKTRLFTSIINDINKFSIQQREAVKILIIAHRTELIDQISESLGKYKVAHGIIAGSRKKEENFKLPVQVASIQTLTNIYNIGKAEKLNAQFVIIDEAHHALASTYKRLWKMYPNAKYLGVTATPWRMNHQGFTDLFDTIILSMPIKDFIKHSYLSPYKYYSLQDKSLIRKTIDDIEVDRFGEYKEASMEEKMDVGPIRAQLLNSYLKFAKGKRGIIYAININHAKHICREYIDAGFNAVCIDSRTTAKDRKDLVGKFKNKEIDIIVNVDVFSEGFDCPDIEFIQLARPTLSLVKYLQQVGRGLRPTKNKENCIILDNVGMYSNFGLPDEHRPWNSYFLGKNVQNSPSGYSRKGILSRTDVDMSEGMEDMELIQDSFESSYVISSDQAILNLPPEMTVYEYPFRKVGECPIDDKYSDNGIILGWTTVKEAFELGGEFSKGNDNVQHIKLNGIDYSDVDGDGILKETAFSFKECLPEHMKRMGFSFSLSFNRIISKLKENNFNYKVTEKDIAYNSNNYSSATIIAKDIAMDLNLKFVFLVKGKIESDADTLKLIRFSRNRIHTTMSDYANFLPISGVTIGQTNFKDLKALGLQVFDDTFVALTIEHPATYFRCNCLSKIVEKIEIPGDKLPAEWPEAKDFGLMTYNKWLRYFDKYGFIIQMNEALLPSVPVHPQIVALQPFIGLKVTVTLEYSFKVRTKANRSKSICQCDIVLI